MKPRSIELHIDELVLRGLPGVDRYRLAAELEQRLTEGLREARFEDIASNDVEVSVVNAPSIEIGAGGPGPADQLAQSILSSISPGVRQGTQRSGPPARARSRDRDRGSFELHSAASASVPGGGTE